MMHQPIGPDQMQFRTAIPVPGVHYGVHLIAVTHVQAILETRAHPQTTSKACLVKSIEDAF